MFVEMIFKFSNPCWHEEKTCDEGCVATNVQRKFLTGCSNIFFDVEFHHIKIQVAYEAVSYTCSSPEVFPTLMSCQKSCYLILLILSCSVWQFVIAIFVIFRSSSAVTSLFVFVAISHLA